MMYGLIAIIGMLITIFFVIGTHEAAHFIAARLAHVKVIRFSIGFGKTLFRFKDKQGTEYVFSLIPLGGYVKMLGEDEEGIPKKDLHLAFNRQPLYKKFFIVLAGPFMNILCALILYWLIFMIGFTVEKPIIGAIAPHSIAAAAGLKPKQEIVGIDQQYTPTWSKIIFRILAHAGNQDKLTMQTKTLGDQSTQSYTLDLTRWHLDSLTPDPLASLGITPYMPYVPLVIGAILKKSPAASSSLQVDDKIVAINKNKISNWKELVNFIMENPNKKIIFTIERQNKTIDLTIPIGHQRDLLFKKYGYLGIAPKLDFAKNLLQNVKYGPMDALSKAWHEVVDLTYFNFMLFGKLLTGKISFQSLGGPISIFESAGEALNYGFLPFISFLAFLSLSLGVINLLPIPMLDGGHLLLQCIEAIIKKPLPDVALAFLYRIGLALILVLLVQAFINDILRLY